MSSTIVLTVCTGNYLAQAKAMADSVIKHNMGYTVFIGVVDKLKGRVNAAIFQPHQLIEVENLDLSQFEEMKQRYNLLELSCALKSFYAAYLFDNHNPEKIIYLDSDILVFDSFAYVEEMFNEYSILLTPHITKPFPLDDKRPTEREMLKNGIYNAGFFALKNDINTKVFLDWWKERMIDQCYNRPKEGLMVDQNWLNFVPIFFDKVYIIKHLGHNVAYWNLHERNIEKDDNKYYVNNEWPLIFFHYSGYSLEAPNILTRHGDRFELNELPVIRELFSWYSQELINNNYKEMTKLECFYARTNLLQNIFKRIK